MIEMLSSVHRSLVRSGPIVAQHRAATRRPTKVTARTRGDAGVCNLLQLGPVSAVPLPAGGIAAPRGRPCG
jgi:hypothetical protein